MFVGIGVGIGRNRFAQGIFNAYNLRVVADGGITEAGNCVDAVSSLLQSASLLLIPSGYKSTKLYSEIPTNGNGDLTWTRASDAWRTNADGLIQRVPWNLLTNSNDLSQASWSKSNITVTLNSIANPLNGLVNAQTFTPNTTNGLHYAFSNQTTPAGQTYLMSFYVKANGYTNCRVENAANSTGVWFNLSNGTITSGTGGTITALSNGWYFVSVLLTSSGSSTGPLVSFAPSTSLTFAGDGTSGGYVFGAQLVEGSSAQTYFPTTDRLNVPRLSYMYGSCPSALLEPQRTNSLRNSTMQGAVAGTPGTLPTNWSESLNGLVRQSVALGTENGVSYIDIRYSGTATGGSCAVLFETATQIVASTSQTWSNSVYLKIIAQPNPPVAYRLSMWEYNTSGTVFGGSFATAVVPTTTSLQRFTQTRALTGATTDRVRPLFDVSMTSGQSYDFTIRIAAPQMELGAFATTWINTTNATATRVADSFSRSNIYTNGLISASGGTWFVELRNNVSYTRDASGQFGIDTASGGQTNGFSIRNGVPGQLNISKYTSGAVLALWATADTTVKIAIKWNGTSADVFVNGTKVVSATSFTTTAMEFLLGNGNDVPKFIQQMALFPTPLSDTDCTTLTTL